MKRHPAALSSAFLIVACSSLASAQEAAAVPAPGGAAVTFSSPTAGVRFDAVRVDGLGRRGDAPASCVAPCTTSLAAGRYALALSVDGAESKVAGQVVLSGPATIEGIYASRAGARRAGWYTLAAGVVGGFALGALSLHARDDCFTLDDGSAPGSTVSSRGDARCVRDGWSVDRGLMLAAIGVLAVGGGVGAWLIGRKDEVSFTVTPLVSVARSEGVGAVGSTEGVGLRGTF